MNYENYDWQTIRDDTGADPIDIFDCLTPNDPKFSWELMTDRGWPRPRNAQGLPVPWVSPSNDLAKLEPSRRWAAILGRLCQVCGEGHEDHHQVICLINQKPPKNLKGKVGMAQSDAMLHERCAKLSLGRCPGLGGLLTGDELYVVAIHARHLYLTPDDQTSTEGDGGTPRIAFDVENAQAIVNANVYRGGVQIR